MLSDEDKEKMVRELLAQDKPYREICKLAKVSPATVSRIKKETRTNGTQSSIRRRAFKIFKRGKKPVDVAILLDTPYDEVKKLWIQYLDLNKESVLLGIRDELRNNFQSFFNLYKEMKSKLLTVNEMIRALEVVRDIEEKTYCLESLTDKISEAEDKNNKLQNEIQGKLSVLTGLNSEIFGIRKLKNSLLLRFRQDQERMRYPQWVNPD